MSAAHPAPTAETEARAPRRLAIDLNVVIALAAVLVAFIGIVLTVLTTYSGVSAAVRAQGTEIRSELSAVRTEVLGEVGTVRTEVLAEVAAVRTEVLAEVAEVRTEVAAVRSDVLDLRDSVHAIDTRLVRIETLLANQLPDSPGSDP